MRARRVLVAAAGLLGTGGVVAALAATGPVNWGKASEVPGTAALNVGGQFGADARLRSVSCSSAHDCAAAGSYTDATSNLRAFVVDESNGVWNKATKVPGTEALGVGSEVNSISCFSPGNCAAGGDYDNDGYGNAFVVDETNGVWGNAIEVPGTAALNAGGQATVFSVSCAGAQNCTAGGFYRDGGGSYIPFVVDENSGVWGQAIAVPGVVALTPGLFGSVSSVSCASPGNCAAGGSYTDSSHVPQAFVVDETNGVWGDAIEVPGTDVLNAGGDAGISSVSCAGDGDCTAGGTYEDSHLEQQAFVVDEANGVWSDAAEVPGTAALNSGGNAEVGSISCTAAGECAAGGLYEDGSGHFQAYVVSESNSAWSDAVEVPGTAALNSGNAQVDSVSCGANGDCAAGGSYTDGSHHGQAFVVSEANGTWNDAVEVPGTAALNHGDAWTESVSCAAANDCTAGGSYTDGSKHRQAFVTGPASTTTSACIVPRVVGKSLRTAKDELNAAHCRLGWITEVHSKVKKSRVIAQHPKPGTHLKAGKYVTLTVSKGKSNR